jgi:DNA-binding CsgD family transcriptional regulator
VFESLSDRELEVLFSIGQGRGTRQIANDTGLSVKTIESHRAHLKEKLQLKTAPELVCAAVKWVLTLY